MNKKVSFGLSLVLILGLTSNSFGASIYDRVRPYFPSGDSLRSLVNRETAQRLVDPRTTAGKVCIGTVCTIAAAAGLYKANQKYGWWGRFKNKITSIIFGPKKPSKTEPDWSNFEDPGLRSLETLTPEKDALIPLTDDERELRIAFLKEQSNDVGDIAVENLTDQRIIELINANDILKQKWAQFEAAQIKTDETLNAEWLKFRATTTEASLNQNTQEENTAPTNQPEQNQEVRKVILTSQERQARIKFLDSSIGINGMIGNKRITDFTDDELIDAVKKDSIPGQHEKIKYWQDYDAANPV